MSIEPTFTSVELVGGPLDGNRLDVLPFERVVVILFPSPGEAIALPHYAVPSSESRTGVYELIGLDLRWRGES